MIDGGDMKVQQKVDMAKFGKVFRRVFAGIKLK